MKECMHPALPPVVFDEATARELQLPASEVRARWPRGYAPCPDCGLNVISYASYSHYLYGDW